MAEARRNVQNLLPVIPAGHVSKSPEKGPAPSGNVSPPPAEDTDLGGRKQEREPIHCLEHSGSLRMSGKSRGWIE